MIRIFFEVLSVSFGLLFVLWSKRAVDIAMGSMQGSLKLSLIYIVLFVALSILFGIFASWISESIRIKMTIQLQNTLVNTQMLSVWSEAKKWHTGDLLVRINSDCNEVTQMLADSFPSFIVTCVKLIASVSFLWIIDPMLAWMILSITPLFLFSKIYYKKVRRLSKDAKYAESQLGTVIQESLKNRLLIRALQATKNRFLKINDTQDNILKLKTKQLAFSVITQGIIKMTFNGGYLLAFLWGIYRLHNHEISFGTMTAFLQLVGKIQMPIFAMIAFIPAAIRATTSIDRLIEISTGEKEHYEESIKLNNIDQLNIDKVTFSYDDQNIVEELSLKILSGEPAAIVGASGKGKTTLIRLILALVNPTAGNIYVLSKEKKYPISAAMRSNFAYVPQGNSLFSGTIRENLMIGNSTSSEDDLKLALKNACAEFVFSFPDGLDTLIGESGLGLSEGQAQRIAIARALLRNSNIWLFDEITSALDTKTSKQLLQNLCEIGREKIIIFVTHDLHLTELCSQTIHIY